MARDAFEYDVGGELRDQYGRKQLVVTTKHATPRSTDTTRGYTAADADGRDQVVLLDGAGHDLSPRIAITNEAPLNPLWPEYGAKFDGSTDDTTAWNKLIAAITGVNGAEIYVPPVGTSIVSQLTFPINSRDLVIVGGGSRNSGGSCRLLSHYGGSGSVVTFNAAAALRFTGFSIYNDNAAFTGRVLDLSRGAGSQDTTQCEISNLRVQAVTQAGSAVRLVQLTRATISELHGVYLNGGAYGVEGLTTAGDYCNANTVGEGTLFSGQDLAGVHNLGAGSRVMNATFEPLRSGAGGAYLQDPTLPGQAISFQGNWTGDASAIGNWFVVNGAGYAFIGNMIVSGGAGSKGIVTNGNMSGLVVMGNYFTSLTNALDPTTGTHDHVVFFGNAMVSVTTGVPTGLTNLGTGSIVQDGSGSVTRFAGDIVVDNGVVTQARLGNVGGSSPILFLGTAEDTGIFRSSAGVLRTSQQFSTKLTRSDLVAPTYGASITLDASAGEWQTITVTNGTAFTMFQPSNAPASAKQELTVEIFNNSGGVMGAISWSGTFVFAGFTWANPANGFKRYVRFEYNGAKWIATSMSSADYT